MMPAVDFSKLVPCAEFAGEDAEDDALLREMIERGQSFLSSFPWCRKILECHIGDIAVGGIVVVLLLRIEPARRDIDEWLWVIAGDLPPAYLVTDEAPNAASALDAYMGEMERWVAAVKAGEPVDGLIPVETSGGGEELEPTLEVATDLERRLRFLNKEILSDHAEDLTK
jgi:hypothetical protein